MQATVYKSTGSWYTIKDEEGNFLKARIKGKLKIDGRTSTNPIAVGDVVTVEKEPVENAWMISEILPRLNYINRVSPHNKYMHHIVAANLHQSLLFATLRNPKTSLGFIDRFLVISEAYHIPAVIVFNKEDLHRQKENDQFEHIKNIYEPIGYKVMRMSVETGEGISDVEELMQGKVSLLSGHSGVGKSSFINYLFPELKLKTLDVSDWSGKGQHSTTFAEMFDLEQGGKLIDTPGIRELGIVDISKAELSHYFPEMRAVLSKCKYNDCSHLDEPVCGVKDAVNAGTISQERYISYLTIRDSIEERTY